MLGVLPGLGARRANGTPDIVFKLFWIGWDCLHTLPCWGIGSAMANEMMAIEKIVKAIILIL
jgi:hypothetical protein